MPPVSEQGSNEYLRFSSLSNAGFEIDGNQKTNQDSFISLINFGNFSLSLSSRFALICILPSHLPNVDPFISWCGQEIRPFLSLEFTMGMAPAAISSPGSSAGAHHHSAGAQNLSTKSRAPPSTKPVLATPAPPPHCAQYLLHYHGASASTLNILRLSGCKRSNSCSAYGAGVVRCERACACQAPSSPTVV